MSKVDILAIGAHPDDVELSCSGTLLTHIALGKKVGLLDLTQGELGSRGSAAIRLKEAEYSRNLMDAEWRINLGLADGYFNEDKESLIKIIEIIRFARPKIILCNATNDRHPDHGRSSNIVSRACFLSGLIKTKTQYAGKTQEAYRPKSIYHYIQDQYIHPDIIVDISAVFEEKMALIKCFKSQFYSPKMEGIETPISGKSFLEYIRSKDKLFARPLMVDYAEGFTVERPLGIKDLFNLD